MARVILIRGDWIGPEICDAMQVVLQAAGADIDWEVHELEEGPLSESFLAACEGAGAILHAKLDAERIPGQLPPTVALRQKLGLWGTLRPVKALPGVPARFPELDLLVVRETSEDIYSGFEHTVTEGVFEAVKVTTPAACERIARFAFDTAKRLGRSKVTVVHKANIMKQSDGLFLRTALNVAQAYPEIAVEDVIVDALCMRLVRWPQDFDVLLAGNLFGDIVSDLASGLAGGIVATPSASYGDGALALFENPHGKAPELVGTGKANPIPMLRPAIMMLEHLGQTEPARRIDAAINQTCQDGFATPDMGGAHSLAELQTAIVERL